MHIHLKQRCIVCISQERLFFFYTFTLIYGHLRDLGCIDKMTLLSELRYYTIADNIVYDWNNIHSAKEIEKIQAVYISFSDDSDEGDNSFWIYWSPAVICQPPKSEYFVNK